MILIAPPPAPLSNLNLDSAVWTLSQGRDTHGALSWEPHSQRPRLHFTLSPKHSLLARTNVDTLKGLHPLPLEALLFAVSLQGHIFGNKHTNIDIYWILKYWYYILSHKTVVGDIPFLYSAEVYPEVYRRFNITLQAVSLSVCKWGVETIIRPHPDVSQFPALCWAFSPNGLFDVETVLQQQPCLMFVLSTVEFSGTKPSLTLTRTHTGTHTHTHTCSTNTHTHTHTHTHMQLKHSPTHSHTNTHMQHTHTLSHTHTHTHTHMQHKHTHTHTLTHTCSTNTHTHRHFIFSLQPL